MRWAGILAAHSARQLGQPGDLIPHFQVWRLRVGDTTGWYNTCQAGARAWLPSLVMGVGVGERGMLSKLSQLLKHVISEERDGNE